MPAQKEMAMERQNSVYVRMLEDVLKKKEHLLRRYPGKRTREQEALLKQEELDQERFHEILEGRRGGGLRR